MMGQMQRNHFTQGMNKLGLLTDIETSWQTGTSLQWLALEPHNKKVLGSNPRSATQCLLRYSPAIKHR